MQKQNTELFQGEIDSLVIPYYVTYNQLQYEGC